MGRFIGFLMMALVKVFSHAFYRGQPNWLNGEHHDLKRVNLLVFLNHTSLFEPLLIRMAPWSFVWQLSRRLLVPGADVTLKKPVTGRLLKLVLPGVVPITRKNDHSWTHFLDEVNDEAITAILPEGRMKRANGLDKHGKPMSVRGGVADILSKLDEGHILFVYSGGLHHVQTPGQRWPRLFKSLTANLEVMPLQQYIDSVDARSESSFKSRVVADMNWRLMDKVP